MIALYINDIQAKLQPNTAVTFELFSNLLDLEFISGAKSYSFTLPTLPNKNLFGSPETVANTSKELFKDYPAKVYFNGILLYQGLFKLTAADKKSYKGNFRFDISEISAYRDKSIREILPDDRHTFASQDLTELGNYVTKDSNIVFPTIKINNDTFNRYTNGVWYTENDVKDGTFMPFLKAKYILELLIQKIGYKVINTNWTATTPDFERVTIWNNRELECEVTVENTMSEISDIYDIWANNYSVTTVKLPKYFLLKDHLPDIKLGDFINGLRKMFGILPVFDSKFKTVKLYFLKDIFSNADYIDWTEKAEPFPLIENNDYAGLEFAFKRDEKDNRIKNQPKEVDYTRLTDVDTKDKLNTTIFTDDFKAVRLCKNENRFYQKDRYPGALLPSWFELHDNILNSKIDEGTTKIETPFSPVQSGGILQFKGKDGKARSSPLGTLWLIHNNPFLTTEGYVILTKGQNQKLNYPASITQNAATFIELDNFVPFTVDEDGIEWTRFLPTPMPTLEVETPDTRPFIKDSDGKQRTNTDFAARLFLYHGLQEQKTTSFSYPYASSDIYSPKGTKIAEFGLFWEGEDGLLDYFFSKFLQIKKYGYPVSYKLRLNINDLLNLDILKKIRIRDTLFFIKELKVSLSEHIKEVDCVLFKIPTPVDFLVDVPVIVYQDCDVDVPVTVYKDCPEKQYKVIVQNDFGGFSNRPGTTIVNEGEGFSVTIGAYSGYEIASISLNGQNIDVPDRTSRFIALTNIKADQIIIVTIRNAVVIPDNVIVNISNPNGGITSPQMGNNNVVKGSNFSYSYTLLSGYEIVSITANGAARANNANVEYGVMVNTNIVILTRLTASAPPNTYTVSVNVSGGGTSPQAGSTTVNAGSTFAYSFTPNSGYMLDYVRVNGVNVSVYSIVGIQANQVVEIVFKPIPAAPTFTVTLQTSNVGGNFSPLQGSYTVAQGASYSYSITPISGYEIDTLTLNGVPVSFTTQERAGLSRLISNIQANQTAIASFRTVAPTTVILTAMAGNGGTISPTMSSQIVPIGSSYNFLVAASSGYEIDTITINGIGQAITNRANMTIPILSIAVDTAIYVTFRAATPAITVTLDMVNGQGTANMARVTYINFGGSYSARIKPIAGYQIDRVWVYSDAIGVASSQEIGVNNPRVLDINSLGILQSITYRITFKPL